MKKFIKNHPIFFTIIVVVFCALSIYIYLLVQLFRPLSLKKGRWESTDKSWSEIQPKFQFIHIGDKKNQVNKLLGFPDQKIYKDTSVLWSYEQYGVVAPGLVYVVEFSSDTVIRTELYEW
jgi:hypothetical protein